MVSFKFEIRHKPNYSRGKWRLVAVTPDGAERELYQTEAASGYKTPVCFETKQQAVDWVLDRYAWYQSHANAGIIPSVWSANWRSDFTGFKF